MSLFINPQGLKALHSPHTGVVDWGEVTKSYGRNFENMGGQIHLGMEVTGFETTTDDPEHPVTIKAKNHVNKGSIY